MRRISAVGVVTLLLAVAFAGCLDPFRPVVDEQVLGDAPLLWTTTRDPAISNGMLGPNLVETEYRHEPADNEPQYPGVLIVIGIRSFSRLDTAELLERTRELVKQSLIDEGVVETDDELTGERMLASGASTSWFRIVGEAKSNSVLFSGEEEVRVLGESWYDGRSKTNIVAVAMAQTTNTGLLGGVTRNEATWQQIIGDPEGAIEDAVNDQGFIYHVRSHS